MGFQKIIDTKEKIVKICCSLMANRSLFVLITARSVSILLECFLVGFFIMKAHWCKNVTRYKSVVKSVHRRGYIFWLPPLHPYLSGKKAFPGNLAAWLCSRSHIEKMTKELQVKGMLSCFLRTHKACILYGF